MCLRCHCPNQSIFFHGIDSLIDFFHVEKTFRALACHMFGNYSKKKSEIMKHYQKDHLIFFILSRRYWDFKTLLEKAKPILVHSSSDKQKALIRNVASQPFRYSILFKICEQQFYYQSLLKSKRVGYFFYNVGFWAKFCHHQFQLAAS